MYTLHLLMLTRVFLISALSFGIASVVSAYRLPIGLGIVQPKVDTGVAIELYADIDAALPTWRFAIVEDPGLQSLTLVLQLPASFRIEGISLDYYIFTFRVVSTTEECLEVITNGEDGRTMWLRRGPANIFKS